MIKGVVRFDGLTISNIMVDFTKQQLHIEATAAFVDSNTGETHGWTKAGGRVWSKESMQKLKELTELMERDLANLHLTETSGAPKEGSNLITRNLGGISEHIGTGDAPSV